MFRVGLSLLLASLILIAGCNDPTCVIICPVGGSELLPFATTADQLLANFTFAYGERNFADFDALLHEDFVFFFAPEDVSLSPSGQGFWERSLEVAATQRMFEGSEGLRPDGSVQPGIQSIDLGLTPLQPTWEDASGEGAEYVGTLKRRYLVDMSVDYTEGDLISEVTGEQVLYVKPVPTAQDGGVMVDVYELIFWRDLGRPVGGAARVVQTRGTDSPSWSRVKANFGG